MTRLPFIIFSLIVAASLFGFEPSLLAQSKKYKIGVLLPLTGEFASYGEVVREGVESFSHPQIEYVFEDSGCDSKTAISSYKKVTELDKLQFLIGPCCGSPQKVIAPMVARATQVVMLPNSAPGNLHKLSNRRVFSAQYAIDEESRFMAKNIEDRGLKKVALVYLENDFSRAHEDAFRAAFKGEVVAAIRYPSWDSSYLKSTAIQLKKLSFDALYLPDAAPMMMGLLSELKKGGVSGFEAFSVYSAQMDDVLKAEGKNVEGLLYSYPEIGLAENAVGYFPQLAAKKLGEAVLSCKGSVECVLDIFQKDDSFDEFGSLKGKIVLKTVKDGTFVLYRG